jgi:hypothetical protein
MRLLPILAVAAASLSLAACTVNTAPANPPPPVAATVVTPAPMMTAPAAGSTVVVRP